MVYLDSQFDRSFLSALWQASEMTPERGLAREHGHRMEGTELEGLKQSIENVRSVPRSRPRPRSRSRRASSYNPDQ
eukprot:gene26390-biopygen16243